MIISQVADTTLDPSGVIAGCTEPCIIIDGGHALHVVSLR